MCETTQEKRGRGGSSGTLFELATDGPGFMADEEREELGASLVLPP